MYTVLRLAFHGVVRDGLVTKNAAAVVKRLGVARTEARHAATVDVTALLNAADGLRCRDMLVLIAATEMPRGEALGLRWTDIDLDAGLVDRARHPRAHRRQARGVRTQDRPVAALSAPLVAMLRARGKQQAAEWLHAG